MNAANSARATAAATTVVISLPLPGILLKVPKLKGISFQTVIIQRYRHRESRVEETFIEMLLGRCICPAYGGQHRGPVRQQRFPFHH